MKVCSNWDSDCPYQLSVRLGQLVSVSKENEDYCYGEIVNEENHEEGWIQKALLTCSICCTNTIFNLSNWDYCRQPPHYHLARTTSEWLTNGAPYLGNKSVFCYGFRFLFSLSRFRHFCPNLFDVLQNPSNHHRCKIFTYCSVDRMLLHDKEACGCFLR